MGFVKWKYTLPGDNVATQVGEKNLGPFMSSLWVNLDSSFPTCWLALNYVLSVGGTINNTFSGNCPGFNAQFVSPWNLVHPFFSTIDYGLGTGQYESIQESEYEILNDGTLDVSSDGGLNPANLNNISINFGKIKIPTQIRLFDQKYFDNLMDVRIHELLPKMPARWPKEPPKFRQVWHWKAGPGGWPSGPEQLWGIDTTTGQGHNGQPFKKNKGHSWSRADYYRHMFQKMGGNNPGNYPMPDDSVIDAWGSITSNWKYPMPPGILCYNIADYIEGGDRHTPSGAWSWGTKLNQKATGPAGVGKYVVLYEDHPLFVADVYNFKTTDESEMPEEIIAYGKNTEVETGLEYEWIVDGKTVSTDRYYQVWNQARNHDNIGRRNENENNSFDTSAITVTLIVKNKVGSVSTTIQYMVWGGLSSEPVPEGSSDLGFPLDYGLWSDTNNTPQTSVDGPQTLHWGTPFWKTESISGRTDLSQPHIHVPMGAPWGSYYTWDGDADEVMVIDEEISGPEHSPVYPWTIFMEGRNGTWDDDTIYAPPIGVTGEGPIDWNSSDHVFRQAEVLDEQNFDFGAPIPSYAGNTTYIDQSIRIDEALMMGPFSQEGYGTGLGSRSSTGNGYLNFWKDRVWSSGGFPPQPPFTGAPTSKDGANLDRVDPALTGYAVPGNGLYKSIWLRGPNAKEVQQDKDLIKQSGQAPQNPGFGSFTSYSQTPSNGGLATRFMLKIQWRAYDPSYKISEYGTDYQYGPPERNPWAQWLVLIVPPLGTLPITSNGTWARDTTDDYGRTPITTTAKWENRYTATSTNDQGYVLFDFGEKTTGMGHPSYTYNYVPWLPVIDPDRYGTGEGYKRWWSWFWLGMTDDHYGGTSKPRYYSDYTNYQSDQTKLVLV